jgi:hypothetical protein
MSHEPNNLSEVQRQRSVTDDQQNQLSHFFWIISGLDLGEPLHAGGMDFGYAVFERSALNLIFDLAIPQSAFKGDELPLCP